MSNLIKIFKFCNILNSLIKFPCIRNMSVTRRKKFESNNKQINDIEKCTLTLVATGSFNPITFMHLRMFELAKDYLKKQQPAVTVKAGIISPVGDSYGKVGLVSSHHRKSMCELAVKDSSWIRVDSWELNEPQWTPTAKVLQHFEDLALADDSISKVMLLCGADLLQSFTIKDLWLESDIKKIVEHFGMIVVARPTFNSLEFVSQSPLLSKLSKHIHIISELYINDASSTAVRKAVKENKSIKYLTPDPVIDYIKQNELYVGDVIAEVTELAPFKMNRSKNNNFQEV